MCPNPFSKFQSAFPLTFFLRLSCCWRRLSSWSSRSFFPLWYFSLHFCFLLFLFHWVWFTFFHNWFYFNLKIRLQPVTAACRVIQPCFCPLNFSAVLLTNLPQEEGCLLCSCYLPKTWLDMLEHIFKHYCSSSDKLLNNSELQADPGAFILLLTQVWQSVLHCNCRKDDSAGSHAPCCPHWQVVMD